MHKVIYTSIFLTLATSLKVHAIDITEVDGKYSCPDLGNQQQCAMRFEENLINNNKALIQRGPDFINIRLLSGGYKKIQDKESLKILIEVTGHFAIIREQLWEGNTWHVLNLKTGKMIETKGYPLFSPQGDKAICSQQDLDANYSPNILDLYAIKSDELELVFSARPEDDNWGPGHVKWLNNNVVSFSKVRWNPDKNAISSGQLFIKEPHLLKNSDNNWQIMHNNAPHPTQKPRG